MVSRIWPHQFTHGQMLVCCVHNREEDVHCWSAVEVVGLSDPMSGHWRISSWGSVIPPRRRDALRVEDLEYLDEEDPETRWWLLTPDEFELLLFIAHHCPDETTWARRCSAWIERMRLTTIPQPVRLPDTI